MEDSGRDRPWRFQGLLSRITVLISNLDSGFQHVNRERNSIADALSKASAEQNMGTWKSQAQLEDTTYAYYHRPIIEGLQLEDQIA